MPAARTVAEFFHGDPRALAIYRKVNQLVDSLEGVATRIQKSQIRFSRDHPFAAVWRPGQYLAGRRPPLVLSIFLRRRDRSVRWKEIIESRPGRFSHHIELNGPSDVDNEVREWLTEAWAEAGD